MGYREALEAAGATVHQFKEFGSYQGDWWALVTTPSGARGWIRGGYGSCSGCDAFQSEFDSGTKECEEHRYGSTDRNCVECANLQAQYQARLAKFGEGYLDGFMSQAEAESKASQHLQWDQEAQPMLDFIRKHGDVLARALEERFTPEMSNYGPIVHE